MDNLDLIQHLESSGVLTQSKIKQALLDILREDFVQPEDRKFAYFDNALSIDFGQTISQPTTVVFMLELLAIHSEQKILEIGYGSGWQTAILSKLVGEKGKVYAFEIVQEVAKFGKNNLKKFKIKNLKLYASDYEKKIKTLGEMDRIISGAAFAEIPKNLLEILKIGGKLVAPTHLQDIRLITRKNQHEFIEKIYPGFIFVPITH